MSGRSFAQARRVLGRRRKAPAAGPVSHRGPHHRPAFRTRGSRARARVVLRLVPLFTLAAIFLVDWVTPPEVRPTPWVVLGPAFAAALCGVRLTALYAVLAAVLFWELGRDWPYQGFSRSLPDFFFVLTGGLLAVLACLVRVRREHEMFHVQDIAETTRRVVLRTQPPGWGGLDHAEIYLAADSVARIGGDFYDIQPSPHGTRVLLGDVQGKGLGAVDAAGAVMSTFREAAHNHASLRAVAARLEVRMERQVALWELVGDPEDIRFATAVLASFPAGERDVVELCNFGHEPPLVVGPHGVRQVPGEHGLPLGLGELESEMAAGQPGDGGPPGDGGALGDDGRVPGDGGPAGPRPGDPGAPSGLAPVNGSGAPGGVEGSRAPGGVVTGPEDWPWVRPFKGVAPPLIRVPLAQGETLLMVTDGVTEARDRDGRFYDLQGDVARAVAEDPGVAEPWRLASFVRERTLRHTGGTLADDTTIFAVRRRHPASRPWGSGASVAEAEDGGSVRRTGGAGHGRPG